MIIYISGPMTGIKDLNKPSFDKHEALLKNLEFTVINPANITEGLSYESYMDIAMAHIRACDIVFVLKGYEKSIGAMAEISYARAIKKEIVMTSDFLPYKDLYIDGQGRHHVKSNK